MSRPTFNGALMFPNDYLAAEEFQEKDVTLEIASVGTDELRRNDGSTETCFVLKFTKTKKKLVLNKTNASMIAALHGGEATKWVGCQITLYPTKCKAFGEITPCIRVRDRVPAPKSKSKQPDPMLNKSDPPPAPSNESQPDQRSDESKLFGNEMAEAMDNMTNDEDSV